MIAQVNLMRFLALLLVLTPALASAQLIVIDPGHGGSEPGAVGCSLEEEDVNLDVGSRLRTLLTDAGLRVAMTRTTDANVGLSARASFANSRGADRFISIHANSNGGTPATGTETFAYTSASPRSIDLRDHLQREMIATWGLRDRGGKTANFAVLRETSMPAALTEMGFLNNCGTDARLLGNPSDRQRIAESNYRAILAHLGRTAPMPPTEGTLIGVVFEDVGVGVEDTSRRIGGASVRVMGGPSATAEADTGAFSFELEPGTYTLIVTQDGFEEGRRTCEIAGPGDTWCSVGIARSVAEPDAGPADAGPADAGPPDDAGFDGGAPDADTPDAGDPRPMVDGGCSTGGSTGGALLFLVALLFWRRRLALPVVLGAVWIVGCDPAVAPSTSALDEVRIEVAEESAAFVSLEPLFRLDGAFTDAEIAPRGGRVALGAGFDALQLVSLDDGAVETLAQGERVGFAPVWSDDGARVGYRAPSQTDTAVPMFWRDMHGSVAPPPQRGAHAFADEDDRIVWQRGAERTVLAPPGDRYFAPRASPDGEFVVFRGLATGLYLYAHSTQRLVSLGEGGHARFSPDSALLVFERLEDDGHAIVAGSLRITDLHDEAFITAPLTSEGLARAPSLDAEGRVAYLQDGALVVAQMVR